MKQILIPLCYLSYPASTQLLNKVTMKSSCMSAWRPCALVTGYPLSTRPIKALSSFIPRPNLWPWGFGSQSGHRWQRGSSVFLIHRIMASRLGHHTSSNWACTGFLFHCSIIWILKLFIKHVVESSGRSIQFVAWRTVWILPLREAYWCFCNMYTHFKSVHKLSC